MSRVLVITPTCYVCNCTYFLHITFYQTDSKCVGPMHMLRYFRTAFLRFKQSLVLVLARGARLIALGLKLLLTFCNCTVGRGWAVAAFYVNLWMCRGPFLKDVSGSRKGDLLLVEVARPGLVPPVIVVLVTRRQNLSIL